ncbi:MAG TPA: O-antigen ligase family protein [Kofleriaceae bacterium]|jgi:O-antigen ligase
MRLRDGLSAGFGVAAVGLSVFAIAGRPRWGQIAIVLAITGALAPIVMSRRVLGRLSPLVALATVAALLTALQLIPLPHAILDALNPTATALRDDGAALAGVSAGRTITLDVPGSLAALVFFVALLGVAIVALRTATSESGRYRLVALVALLCVGCAIVGGVHKLFDLDEVYGFYDNTGGQQLLTPLVNGNQSACLLAVGAVLSLGLVMYPRQKSWWRAAWLACAVTCAVGCLMTLSRGGALALGVGVFVAIAVLVAQRLVAHDTPRRRRASFLSSSLPIGIVSVCAVVVVLYATAGGVKDQFTRTSLDEIHAPRSKFAAWHSAIALVDESPWVGIGRGAFEPVFQRVHPASGYATYTHLENEYLQAVVDWGVPGALVLAFIAIWLVVVALRRWRDGPLAAGALGAVAAVLLQSNVDFGIEFFGLAAPMTVVAATLAYVPLRETTPRRYAATRVVRLAHVAALVIGAALLATSMSTPLAEDHRDLEARSEITAEELRGTLSRHPFDYYGYARLAESMSRANQPGAVRLLNHALELHPTDPGLHLAAARMLYAAKHVDQAAIEYAAALPAARDQRRILAEVARRFSPDVAATAIPADVEMIDAWSQQLADLKRDDIAIAWLERVALLKPHTLHVCERLFALGTQLADLAAIDAVKERCVDYQPSQADRLALAGVLRTKHADAEIVSLLSDVESWQGRSDEKVEGWLMLCEAETVLAKYQDAKRCLRRLDGAALASPDAAHRLAADLEHVDELATDGAR